MLILLFILLFSSTYMYTLQATLAKCELSHSLAFLCVCLLAFDFDIKKRARRAATFFFFLFFFVYLVLQPQPKELGRGSPGGACTSRGCPKCVSVVVTTIFMTQVLVKRRCSCSPCRCVVCGCSRCCC